MLVKTYGSAVYGIDATTITIEVNASPGIKDFLYLVDLDKNSLKAFPAEIGQCEH